MDFNHIKIIMIVYDLISDATLTVIIVNDVTGKTAQKTDNSPL
jgi:hypothetical protein